MVITGTYDKTIFRNEQNGFTIFSFTTKSLPEYHSRFGKLICSAQSPIYASGMPLELTGEMEIKNNYKTFRATDVSAYSDEKEVTIKYLSGENFEHIGEKIASKIVDITGPDIFSFILKPNAKDALAPILGANTELFLRTVQITIQQKIVLDFIKPYGGEFSHASKIASQFPIKPIDVLKKNCYKIGAMAGMPFPVCDSIAKSIGYTAYDERRIEAMLLSAMTEITNHGHTYCTSKDISIAVRKIIKSSAFADAVPMTILMRAAHKSKKITIDDTSRGVRYYLTDVFKAEAGLAREIKRIQNASEALPFSDDIVEIVEKECGLRYSAKQRKSFEFLRTTGIKILTGGPGTGKTTVINGLIKAYSLMKPQSPILLCAPTGRAAQKMRDTTSREAYTIHKALDVRPYGDELRYRTLEDPLAESFIIVDEMSMADVIICSMLLGAIKSNALVLLCGDVNQLPSVGPGNVLKDMIRSGNFETVALDVVFRQTEDSDIIYNSNAINKGKHLLRTSSSFQLITVNTEEEIRDKIVQLVWAQYDRNNPFLVQVLSSTKKGTAGTFALNAAIQTACNPEQVGRCNTANFASSKYRIGDKIMMSVNNYKDGYLNGDLGIVKAIRERDIVADINGEEIVISKSNLGDVMLAYAITTHKSQGSEYPTVIIALPSNPNNMLQRNLIYTAITRAQKNVIIVAQQGAIDTAINNCLAATRNSALFELLQK